VTEVRKPVDAALDLFVYLPVGLAVTAAEELPKLAAKGRAQVGTRLAVARLVGQFALARGRQELDKRLAASRTPSTVHPNGAGGGPRAGATPSPSPHPPAGEAVPAPPPPPGPVRSGWRPGSKAVAAGELGIPGYDSLSASQVVQRLDGLTDGELAAVARYEEAHRGRRTILNRVAQLRDR
jgi:hypothetical protein